MVDFYLYSLKIWEIFGEFKSVFEIIMFKIFLIFVGV